MSKNLNDALEKLNIQYKSAWKVAKTVYDKIRSIYASDNLRMKTINENYSQLCKLIITKAKNNYFTLEQKQRYEEIMAIFNQIEQKGLPDISNKNIKDKQDHKKITKLQAENKSLKKQVDDLQSMSDFAFNVLKIHQVTEAIILADNLLASNKLDIDIPRQSDTIYNQVLMIEAIYKQYINDDAPDIASMSYNLKKFLVENLNLPDHTLLFCPYCTFNNKNGLPVKTFADGSYYYNDENDGIVLCKPVFDYNNGDMLLFDQHKYCSNCGRDLR